MTAEVDVGITAGLSARLGRVERALATLVQLQTDPLDTPSFAPLTHHAALNGSGTAIIDLGGPNLGYEWRVRHCSISDNNNWATSMGNAVGQFYNALNTEPASVTIRPGHCVWPFAILPNSATFGADEFPVTYGEHVLCLVTGGTAAELVQASIKVQQFTVRSRHTQIVV